MSATSSAARAGVTLGGRYRLDSPIASGGMAQVWRGADLALDRTVAIKVLHPHLAGDQAFVRRFRREAVAAARLSHPSIVAVYDTVSQPDVEAIVMELIEGRTLRSVLDEVGVLPPADVVDIGIQISQALDAAHRAGIVHRDIKPANIMIGTDRRILVADFGIAKASQDDDLTNTGTLLGTAKYLAPEQVTGDPVDPRADIYALGVVLFEAATGQAPFLSHSDAATALARLREEVPRCRDRRPGIPAALDAAVARAMARDPDHRFDRAISMRSALAGADLTPAPLTAPPPGAPGWAPTGPAPIARPPGPMGPGPMGPGPVGPGPVGPVPVGPAPVPMAPIGVPVPGPPVPLNRSTTGPAPRPNPNRTGPTPVPASGGGANPPPPVSTGPAGQPRSAGQFLRTVVAVTIILGLALVGLLVVPSLVGGEEGADGEPLALVGAEPFDPQGDGSPPYVELNAQAPLAIDGDPETHWRTEGYKGPSLGNLKAGVGLIVDLGQQRQVGHIEVTSPSDGWRLEVYVGSDFGPNGPEFDLADLGEQLAVLEGGDRASASLGGVTGSRVLLWITEAGDPEEDGRHRFRLSEVVIR